MARPRVVEWGASSRPITSETEADDDPFVIGSRLYSRRTDDNAAQRVWFDCTPHPYRDPALGASSVSDRVAFDVDQGPRSRRLLRLSDCGRTVMNEPASAPMHRPETNESTIRTGKLVVNLDERVVSVNDQPVHLTGKEYNVLELLSLRKGNALTKEMIFDHLYGGMDEPELKIIDVFVCKLRKKLAQATSGSHYIETVWGRGYVLRDPAITSGNCCG